MRVALRLSIQKNTFSGWITIFLTFWAAHYSLQTSTCLSHIYFSVFCGISRFPWKKLLLFYFVKLILPFLWQVRLGPCRLPGIQWVAERGVCQGGAALDPQDRPECVQTPPQPGPELPLEPEDWGTVQDYWPRIQRNRPSPQCHGGFWMTGKNKRKKKSKIE